MPLPKEPRPRVPVLAQGFLEELMLGRADSEPEGWAGAWIQCINFFLVWIITKEEEDLNPTDR